MKRFVATALALVMTLSLVACGGTKDTGKTSTPSAPAASTPAASTPAEPAEFKVGAIYINSKNDTAGYTFAHHNGITKAMEDAGEDFRMLVLPDHPTPLRIRTHSADPVPYVLYDSTRQRKTMQRYTEAEAKATGIFEPQGHKLLERLLAK